MEKRDNTMANLKRQFLTGLKNSYFKIGQTYSNLIAISRSHEAK